MQFTLMETEKYVINYEQNECTRDGRWGGEKSEKMGTKCETVKMNQQWAARSLSRGKTQN